MTMKCKNEKGFGVVEIVLVLVIVGLVGVVGFMVYKNQHKATNSTTSTASTTPAQTKTSTTDNTKQTATTTPTPTTTVKPAVVITEWGIKVEFDDADKVTYKMSTDDIGNQYADLYLKDSVASVCQALGVGFSRDNTRSGQDNSNKFGGHYYNLFGGPGACSDDPGGTNGSINQLRVKIIGNELGAGKYTVSAVQ